MIDIDKLRKDNNEKISYQRQSIGAPFVEQVTIKELLDHIEDREKVFAYVENLLIKANNRVLDKDKEIKRLQSMLTMFPKGTKNGRF